MKDYTDYMFRTRGQDNLRSLRAAFRAFIRSAHDIACMLGADPYNDSRGATLCRSLAARG